MQKLITIAQGAVVGLAETIPGISGSTLTVIMGIYDKFIGLLHSFSEFFITIIKFILRKRSKSDLKVKFKEIDLSFGILFLIGGILSVLIFSNIITPLKASYPQYVYAFFFGPIFVSIFIPWKAMKRRTSVEVFIMVISATIFWILFGLRGTTSDVPPSYLKVFIGGFIGISGLLLPGVSGSFILLILGIYDFLFQTIRHFTRFVFLKDEVLKFLMLIFGIGCGFIVMTKLIKFLLTKARSYILAFMSGLLLASLRVMWPFVDKASAEKFENMKKVMLWDTPVKEMIVIIAIIVATIVIMGAIISKRDLLKE